MPSIWKKGQVLGIARVLKIVLEKDFPRILKYLSVIYSFSIYFSI